MEMKSLEKQLLYFEKLMHDNDIPEGPYMMVAQGKDRYCIFKRGQRSNTDDAPHPVYNPTGKVIAEVRSIEFARLFVESMELTKTLFALRDLYQMHQGIYQELNNRYELIKAERLHYIRLWEKVPSKLRLEIQERSG